MRKAKYKKYNKNNKKRDINRKMQKAKYKIESKNSNCN